MSFYIGCHLSIQKGYSDLINKIKYLDIKTFQIFLRNPYCSDILKNKEINIKSELELLNICPILIHSPYIINLCSKNKQIIDRSIEVVINDLENITLNFSNNTLYNIHPGNHMNQGKKKGIELLISSLNEIMNYSDFTKKRTILIESMSGKGTEIGSNF